MKANKFTAADVAKIAGLARIPVTPQEERQLAEGFNTTMGVVDQLFNVDVKGIEPTHQVTGLENVMREDKVDVERMFTRDQALQNAKRTHNGFFMVDQVIDQDE
jgi:aspartyl-tRNA(Asn)/glutamyl-tRNA(Gln) amidotransferase subunit C